MLSLDAFFDSEIAEHETVVEAAKMALREPFARLVEVCVTCIKGEGKIFLFGNGGSAADVQHLATELVVRYKKDRPSIAAIARTTDSSALTAIGNDLGFEYLFSRQLEALGRKGDVVIGISTSGLSPNVLRALRKGREMDLITVGFGGGTGGDLSQVADQILLVPSNLTARMQELHILLGHVLCSAIETYLSFI